MKRVMRAGVVVGMALGLAVCAWSQNASQPATSVAATPAPDKTLWIAKFICEPKAAPAVASIQQDDAAALQYTNLFKSVTSFATDANQPAGSWSLTGKEVSFAGGSTAERVIVGFGSGRAHVEMLYELHDPDGKVVWTKKIKTQPSFWSSSGAVGGVQNQHAAVSQQSQKLINELTKYFSAHP